MADKPTITILNGTCLDVVESHWDELHSIDAEVVADQSFRDIGSEKLREVLSQSDAVIVPAVLEITPELIRQSPRLRCISFAASGYDSIDIEAATDAGVIITNAPVPEGAEVVADMAWGLMLAVSRQIPQHDRKIRAGDFHRGMGVTPWGKTLGIVGLGNIGRCVARRAAGFEMAILATEPQPDRAFANQHRIELVGLEELLERSDYVSLHVRLNDSTRGMIGRADLERFKPTAFLINTARRELVDEAALAQALSENRLAGAGLDDPPSTRDSKLLDFENVVFTTHLGNRARTGVDAVFLSAMKNAAEVLAGRPCRFIVNPQVTEGNLRKPNAHRRIREQP